MSKNIIILGMARSGTSLTASIFANNGYYVDEKQNIAEKNHTNPKGFWESTQLLKRNENFLRATGFGHDNTWRYDEITPQQVEALRALRADDDDRAFLAQFEQRAPWVWKDPRLCYTLGIWWPVLDHDNTLAVLVKRDPEAVYNSYVRIGWRKHSSAEHAATLERTRQHIEHAERLISENNIPSIAIHYEEFSTDPAAVAERINRAAGLELTAADLGYDDRFNHDNTKGRWTGYLDKIADMMPGPLVKLAKSLLPKSLLRSLYPERYE